MSNKSSASRGWTLVSSTGNSTQPSSIAAMSAGVSIANSAGAAHLPTAARHERHPSGGSQIHDVHCSSLAAPAWDASHRTYRSMSPSDGAVIASLPSPEAPAEAPHRVMKPAIRHGALGDLQPRGDLGGRMALVVGPPNQTVLGRQLCQRIAEQQWSKAALTSSGPCGSTTEPSNDDSDESRRAATLVDDDVAGDGERPARVVGVSTTSRMLQARRRFPDILEQAGSPVSRIAYRHSGPRAPRRGRASIPSRGRFITTSVETRDGAPLDSNPDPAGGSATAATSKSGDRRRLPPPYVPNARRGAVSGDDCPVVTGSSSSSFPNVSISSIARMSPPQVGPYRDSPHWRGTAPCASGDLSP